MKKWISLLVVALGALVLAGAALLTFSPAPKVAAPSSIGGPFQLLAHDGQMVTEKNLLGTPTLIFFGFTHCPDICPTKLFEISEIFRAIGDRGNGDKGKDIKAYFVTVDPERDTPDVLKNYLNSFDSRILGLSGDRAAVEEMMKVYRAIARKVPTSSDYTMDHTSIIYLMDKNGVFLRTFNLDRPPFDAAKELLSLL
jgi:protein SCO1